MIDEPTKQVPEAVRKIVGAIVDQALAKCERLGISREAFYRAMVEEQTIHSTGNLPDLIERTFRRLAGMSN